jgi:predicted Zn-ribbon and HTH transcriptional regulator
MADQWYFAWGQNKFGPFTTVEMRELAASGRLQPVDTVWKEGVATGVLASRVKNLFPSHVTSLTPPPPLPSSPVEPEAQASSPEETLPIPEPLPSDADFLLADPPQDYSEAKDKSDAKGETPAPAFASAEKAHASPHAEEKRKGVVMGASGAIILSQDGRTVQFRKKCRKCGYEDTTRATLPIRNGTSRTIFFCPKCKKPSDVEIRGKI